MALFAIAAVLAESAFGKSGRVQSPPPLPTAAAAFDAGRLGRAPALPGDAWRGAGAFWQRNEFRCSFPGPIGRQTSFGVVETLPARPMGPFWRNMRPQTGRLSLILLSLQQNSKPRRVGRLPVSGIITPKLVSLPLGTPRLLRNAICCRRDPGKPMKKSPQPQPLPPDVKNRAGGVVRRTGLSLRTSQRRGRGRAGSRT